MKFDRAANTMLLTVTELASYAFQRENTDHTHHACAAFRTPVRNRGFFAF